NIKVWQKAPRILGLVMGNSGLVLTGTNGTPGGAYSVLASTNLSIPLTNWMPSAVNYFDGNGSFIFTNVIDPTFSQQYFRLLSL
ncbi:MAG: hypothetical protein ABSA45_06985, partial [Verrucomicrobiota bacterium]